MNIEDHVKVGKMLSPILPFVFIFENLSWFAVLLTFLISVAAFFGMAAWFLSKFKEGKARWGFGAFPPGVFVWKGRSREEELEELRSYARWLESELARVKREIEEKERHVYFRE